MCKLFERDSISVLQIHLFEEFPQIFLFKWKFWIDTLIDLFNSCGKEYNLYSFTLIPFTISCHSIVPVINWYQIKLNTDFKSFN